MIDTILKGLKQIEEKYNVKILYACEVGSRAWGLSSPASDFDVRFLYVHSVEKYLSIDPMGTASNRDVIELPILERLDLNGWELTKALRLLRKSNPSLLEWLHTPICYAEAFSTISQIKDILPRALNINTCIRHYINMAKGNISRAQKNLQYGNLKLSINIIRPTLVALWLHRYRSFPPFNMEKLVHSLISDIEVKKLINEIIAMKISGQPNSTMAHAAVWEYFQVELKHLEMYTKNFHDSTVSITDELNTVFRHTLREVSNSDLR